MRRAEQVGLLTRGREALNAWQAKAPKARTQAKIGALLGVTQQRVSAWLIGRSRPDERMKQRLLAVCGIKPELWLTDDELAKERAFAASSRRAEKKSKAA